MMQRCYWRRFRQWADYGGRGITVCERWHTYANFEADMSPRPAGHSIDRINNDLGYSPDNCRWATRRQQQRNRRNTRHVVIDGVVRVAVEVAEELGVKTDTVVARAAKAVQGSDILRKERKWDLSGLALGGKASGAAKRAKTHCAHGHEFTEANTRITKDGWRACRTCHRLKMQRRALAKRGHRS